MDPTHPDYATVITIAQAITNAAGGPDALLRTLGHVLRDSIDDVVKTPKTGRRFYDELQNSEKTYIGTCIEINLRSALELPRGRTLDLHIAGHEVDVKFSAGTAWMIPPEAVGHPCVLITATEATARCSFGVFLAKHEYLNAPNRDQKRRSSPFLPVKA